MRKLVALVAAVVVASTVAEATRSARSANVTRLHDISLELVGQLTNSPPGVTPVTHVHYGYLSYVNGVPAFTAATAGESTALFTFFAEAATVRVLVDGPLRVITRVGKITIYRDPSANGSFDRPDSFRDGTPVMVATFRQQVVGDTVSNTFTAFHRDRITSTTPFAAGRGKVQLGDVGKKFEIVLQGHLNMPGPPSGFFAGHASSR
ncbi:MAG TPA: hypothetical protein VGJ77_11330 [Gaiellaceae bacterium]|jgi:hypothetical protein